MRPREGDVLGDRAVEQEVVLQHDAEVGAVIAQPHRGEIAAVDVDGAADSGRLKVITRLMSVLFPDPLEPTSAVVAPAGAWKVTCFSTGTPGLYSKLTSSNRTSPRTSGRGSRSASSASSVVIDRISRMRSSPANASEIWVPIDAIETSGAATRPVKKTYITKSPSVIVPARIARPPTTIISTPMMPTMSVDTADTVETPTIDFAMFRNSRWAPFANTSASRRSAV